MKKLFTLLALLTCFLSASAKEFVDAEVDFSKFSDNSEIKFYGWGASESARARLSILNGCLHFQSDEATDPSWDCQFHPIGGFTPEVGVVYTLHYKIKGSVEKNVSMLGFGQTPYGQFPITTEWVEGTFNYECTEANGDLLMQCGDYVGDWDIAYLKITHEGEEERPVQWKNILTNGDAEGEFDDVPCFQTKEFGMNIGADGQPSVHKAEIVEEGGNKVFVCHAKEVNPVIVWEEDGEQWGVQHKAGDPKPDNAWQNQVWIVLPRAAKDGEQFKLSFKYKASRNVEVSTQDHTTPGSYLGGGTYGNLKFTTDWQTYEKVFSAAANMQSIAFNLGQEIYTEDMDFYFDDIEVAEMVLDHGYFVAATNTSTGLVDYNYDNATEFVYDESEESYVATVGKKGDKDSWVDEVMISTVRGNTKAFKAATLKCTAKADAWVDYEESSTKKIKLPAAGVWTISIDPGQKQMYFEQVEGEAIKEPLNPEDCINATEVVVNAGERNTSIDEAKADGLLADPENPTEEENALYNGKPWDNQFFLIGNRILAVGEEVYLKFDYKAETAATVGSQNSNGAGGYLHWAGIGNLDFTTDWQTYENTITIPAESNDNQNSWTFNLSNMKEANKYYFRNFIFMTADKTENLIATEGTENLWVKELGVNNNSAYQFGTDPSAGINDVVKDNSAVKAIYNIAGQRVSKDYKGLVIKNGNKYVVK